MTKHVTDKPVTSRRIRGVNISFQILWALQEFDRPGVTELADHLNYSKSTIYSHLVTMEDNEFVIKEGGGYRLSLRILDLAQNVRYQVANFDIIREEVDKLAEDTGEVSQFAIEEYGKISFLYKAHGERSVETASRVGKQGPLHSTGLGKAILANLPSERVNDVIDMHGLEAKTENTITDREELERELAEVRDNGYAIDDEENNAGLRCVAAPIVDGWFVGAVSVVGPSSRIEGKRFEEELPAKVRRAANIIECNIKFS